MELIELVYLVERTEVVELAELAYLLEPAELVELVQLADLVELVEVAQLVSSTAVARLDNRACETVSPQELFVLPNTWCEARSYRVKNRKMVVPRKKYFGGV